MTSINNHHHEVEPVPSVGFVANKASFDYRVDLPEYKGLFDPGTGLGKDILNDILHNPSTRLGLAGLLAYGVFRALGGMHIDTVHAMGNVDRTSSIGELESGLTLSPLELSAGDLQVMHGDGVAIVNIDGKGAYLAPGVHLYDGQEAFDGAYVIDLTGPGVQAQAFNDTDTAPFTRYTITFDSGDWNAARMLVMSSGQRNNSLLMLHNLERVAGYGGTGQIFVDVTPDFSGNDAEIKIWGLSTPNTDGKADVIDLGNDQVRGMEVFPNTVAKSAVLIPATVDNKQVIVVTPSEFTDLHIGDDGLWYALDGKGNEQVLGADGVWTEAISPAEKQLNADALNWGIDLDGAGLDKYEIKDTIDGKKALVDRNTQRVIYYDGAWEDIYVGHFLVEHDMCKKTDWVGGEFGGETPPKGNLTDFSNRYTMPLREYSQRVGKDEKVIFGNRAYLYYLGGPNNCWAEKFLPVMINGERVENPAIVYMMWKDDSGLPQHVKTFKQKDLELVFVD